MGIHILVFKIGATSKRKKMTLNICTVCRRTEIKWKRMYAHYEYYGINIEPRHTYRNIKYPKGVEL